MSRILLRFALGAASALGATSARAFSLLGTSWPDGNIVMHLQLGQPSTMLMDGSPDWATVAESALAEWNQFLGRSHFTVVRDSTASISRNNGINNVAFRADIFGQAFGERTLAVTLSTGRSTEKDVIFNSNRTWNSYRGNLRGGITEFRRVALHEFGHVLGLDHPDEASPVQIVSAVMNSTVSNVETLRPDDIAGVESLYNVNGPSAIPKIAAQPQSRNVQVGDSHTFSVAANGAAPLTYTWTFRAENAFNTETLRLATGPSFTIGSVQPADAGVYRVNVSGPGGVVTSNTATLTVTPVATSRDTLLANISTRGVVGSGNGVLIAGIVVGGTTPKNVLVRAAGPALGDFGVGGALPDPVLEIANADGATVARNDNWETADNVTTLTTTSTRLGAFQFKPGSRDAALLLTLPPGNYTAVVSGAGGTSGVALVEAYDADANAATSRTRKFINIATRGQVRSGEDVLIAGLVVAGPGPRTYLIRAVGPTLTAAPFGVSGALNDPYLQLYLNETLLRENDDWDSPLSAQPALREAAAKVGAFALQSRRDAAMIVTLQPGSYTAKVTGFEGATGVSLVEVYEIPE